MAFFPHTEALEPTNNAKSSVVQLFSVRESRTLPEPTLLRKSIIYDLYKSYRLVVIVLSLKGAKWLALFLFLFYFFFALFLTDLAKISFHQNG